MLKTFQNIFLIFLLFFPSKDCSGLINIGHFQKEAASQWRCKTKITCNNSLPYAQGKLFINGFNEYKIVLTFIYFQCVYYLRDSATSTSNVKIFPKLAPSSSKLLYQMLELFLLRLKSGPNWVIVQSLFNLWDSFVLVIVIGELCLGLSTFRFLNDSFLLCSQRSKNLSFRF